MAETASDGELDVTDVFALDVSNVNDDPTVTGPVTLVALNQDTSPDDHHRDDRAALPAGAEPRSASRVRGGRAGGSSVEKA